MKKILIATILLLTFSSCRKSVLKTHPELVGHWRGVRWCVVESSGSAFITIGDDGKGRYYSSYNDVHEDNFSGKVKTKGDDLYVGRKRVATILDIADTSGYIYNPNSSPSLCSADSIYVSALLKIKNLNGSSMLFYKD